MVNGSVLTFTPDGLDSSFELQCLALNPESAKTLTSTTIIEIRNPVSVRPSTAFPIPMLGQDFSLTCQGSHRGLPVAWFKDGQTVSPDGEMIRLQEHNTTLHFNSLLPSDGGFYQCEAALDDSDVMSQGYLLDCE
ncbi:cell adhesion molecule CEACAM20-like [Aplochiton taeniatus]